MMKVTRGRTLLVGLMLAAVGGLAYDRLTFAGVPSEMQNTSSASPPTADPPASITPARSEAADLAARLATLAKAGPSEPGPRRSPFGAMANAERPSEVLPSALSTRWSQRVLSGVVLKANGRPIAIVDGKALSLGAELDGLRLVSVSKDAVVFSNGTTQFTLKNKKQVPQFK